MLGTFTHIAAIGFGATAFADISALALNRLFQTPLPDYSLVGRWLSHMPDGRFPHARIAVAEPMPHERPLGWATHYAVGAAFAGLMIAATGLAWLQQPTLAPAVLFGLVSVSAPFLIMQPAFGLGVAAARAQSPWAARRRSLTNHMLFGIGLYLNGTALAALSTAMRQGA
jgi:hypothetical protein